MRKKDYCVRRAFESLIQKSEKRNMNQQIQNLRQMNQDFDQKIKQSEYQKTVTLLNLMDAIQRLVQLAQSHVTLPLHFLMFSVQL